MPNRVLFGIAIGGCTILLIWCIAIPETMDRHSRSSTVKAAAHTPPPTRSTVGRIVETRDVASAKIRMMPILWGDREPETAAAFAGIDPANVAKACIQIMNEAGPTDRRSILALETLSYLGRGVSPVQAELLEFAKLDEWRKNARRILRAVLAPGDAASGAAGIAMIRAEWSTFLEAWTWGRHSTCIELLRELSDHRVDGAADLFMELTAEVSSRADSDAPDFAIPDAGPDSSRPEDGGAPILRSTLQGALARELVRCTALLDTPEAAARLKIALGSSPNFLSPIGLASAIICLQQRPNGPLAEMLRPKVLESIRPGAPVHEYVRITALTVAGLYGEDAIKSLRETIMLSKDASTFVAAVGGIAEATYRSKSPTGIAFLRELLTGPLAPDARTDTAGEIRRDVYRALFHAGDANDRARLMKRLETTRDPVEEWAILLACETVNPPSPQVVEKMRHRSVHAQRGSMFETRLRAALVEYVARTATDKDAALAPYLRDADPGVAERARRARVRVGVEKLADAESRLQWLRNELSAPLPLSHRRILYDAVNTAAVGAPDVAARIAKDAGAPGGFRCVLASAVLPRLSSAEAADLLPSLETVFAGDPAERNRHAPEIWTMLSVASSMGDFGRAWCSKVSGSAPPVGKRLEQLGNMNQHIEAIHTGGSPR